MLRKDLIRFAYQNPEHRSEMLPLLKNAALQDAPMGRVLGRYWNTLHDFEQELGSVIHEYDVAASYRDGAGSSDAKKVMEAAKGLRKAVAALASRELEKALKQETAFVRKHGDPESYVEQQRNAMFPR